MFISSDLINRGYGVVMLNFLECLNNGWNNINQSPFKLAEKFVEKAWNNI